MGARLKMCLLNTFAMFIGLGSEGKQTLGELMLVAEMYRHLLRPAETASLMAFDTHFASQRRVAESVESPSTTDPLAQHFIRAELLDAQSRQRLWEEGRLWFLPVEECMRPGIRADGMGTGQNPGWGRALYLMNRLTVLKSLEQGMRAFHSARRRLRATVRDGNPAQEDALPCIIFGSVAGGVATGALVPLAKDIREVAAAQGVKVKIIVCLIDLGTLYPANKSIAERNRQLLLGQEIAGLQKGQLWLDGSLAEVKGSDQWVAEKHEAVLQAEEAAADELNACWETIDELSQRDLVGKVVRSATYWDAVNRYGDVLGDAIRLVVDRHTCGVAHEHGYLRIEDLLLGKQRSLQQIADPEFLMEFWSTLVGEIGLDKMIHRLANPILAEHGSLLDYIEQKGDQLAAALTQLAREAFASRVDSLDVLSVLRERFAQDRLEAIIARLLKESRPRVVVRGEVEDAPHVKLIGVPRGSDYGWLRDMVARVDRTSGDCELVEHDEPNTVTLLAYRSSISLSARMEQHRLQEDQMPASARLQGAQDPFAAFLPNGKPRVQDARVAAIYAHAAGILDYQPEEGYCLSVGGGQARELGTTASDALSCLQRNFPDVVHIYSVLGQPLIGDGHAVLGRLQGLATSSAAEGDNPVVRLCDDAALARAIDEVKTLLPYLEHLNGRGSHLG